MVCKLHTDITRLEFHKWNSGSHTRQELAGKFGFREASQTISEAQVRDGYLKPVLPGQFDAHWPVKSSCLVSSFSVYSATKISHIYFRVFTFSSKFYSFIFGLYNLEAQFTIKLLLLLLPFSLLFLLLFYSFISQWMNENKYLVDT